MPYRWNGSGICWMMSAAVKCYSFFSREIGSQHFQFCFFKCIAFDDDIYMTLHFRSRILISARANVFFCPTFALSFEWAALSSSSISSSSRTFSLRWFSSSTTSNFVTRSYQYRSIYLLAVYSKAWKIEAC